MIDNTILMPHQSTRRPRGRRLFILFLLLVALAVFSARTAISYYVDALWFSSLGYRAVFWRSLSLEWVVFGLFLVATFAALYGWFAILMRLSRPELRSAGTIRFGNRIIQLPVEGALRMGALIGAVLISLATAASMMADWPKFALYWYQPHQATGIADPIFGRSLGFYLFTLPVWQSIAGWLLMIAVLLCAISVVFALISGGAQLIDQLGSTTPPRSPGAPSPSPPPSCCWSSPSASTSAALNSFSKITPSSAVSLTLMPTSSSSACSWSAWPSSSAPPSRW